MVDGPNLFARLHKWAARQDENFLTESLAVVLEQLLILAPEAATRIIRQLTGGFLDVPPRDAVSIEIQTQVEMTEGRPDLELRRPGQLVWVEVKVESELRIGQLEGYRVLMEGKALSTRLILLTRYPESYPSEARPDVEVRWFEVADWLESEFAAIEAADRVAGYLTQQFLSFLGTRRMRLAQVNKFMPEGVRAFANLLDMLFEVAAACKVSATMYAGRESSGIKLDGRKYWIGVAFQEPDKLWFGTYCQIDREAAVRLGVGEIEEVNWIPGGYRWWRSVDLESESVHFFLRSKVGQMQCLEAFLRECLEQARSIETPDQPPTPDEPEGD